MTTRPIDGPQRPYAGLCAGCSNVRVMHAQTGSTFYRCALAATDPRYPKYPRMPVLACDGYLPRDVRRL